MKKYIDTEWLENNAKEYSLGYYEEDEWATPLNALDSAPSIDIVRCRECKYWNEEDHWCNIRDSYGWDYKPDDFCSYGESDSEKTNNSEIPTGSERNE